MNGYSFDTGMGTLARDAEAPARAISATNALGALLAEHAETMHVLALTCSPGQTQKNGLF